MSGEGASEDTGFPPLGYDPEAPGAESSGELAERDGPMVSADLSAPRSQDQPQYPGDAELAGISGQSQPQVPVAESTVPPNPTTFAGYPADPLLDSRTGQPTLAIAAQPGPASGGPATAIPSSGDYRMRLEMARRQYWEGQLEQARDSYQQLVDDFPDRADAATELGNLLLQSGDESGATMAYGTAIPRLINLQRDDEAINLVRFISRYNPVVADALYKKHWQAR
jgi:hypothetical protein